MNVKKNWFMRIGVVSICLALISCVLVGGTFAKYISTVGGAGSARVGYFYFDKNTTDTKNFKLAATTDTEIKSANGENIIVPGTYGNFAMNLIGMAETDVKIAYAFEETNPGNVPIVYDVRDDSDNSLGYYSDKLTGTVSLKLPEENTYDYSGGYTTITIDGDLNDMAEALAGLCGTGGIVKAGADYSALNSNTYVNWFWAFENNTVTATLDTSSKALAANDQADTTLGNGAYDANAAAGDNVKLPGTWVTLKATVTATQVD